MVVILVHFDDSVIVPVEPVSVPAPQVVMLVDAPHSALTADLDKATREYYQHSSSDADDENWGTGAARDSAVAWDQE